MESKIKIMTVKVSGTVQNIERFHEFLKESKDYQIISTSRVFPNQNSQDTFHVFIDLLPLARQKVEAHQ